MEDRLSAGDEFIDRLLLDHRISLRAVYDFADEHMEDLRQAGKIYKLKTGKDIKLCLSVFRLISREYAGAIGECFCAEYNIEGSPLDDLFFEQNKLFLIAAFIYNPSFFAKSWNLCGIIISRLAFEAGAQKETQKPESVIIIVWTRKITGFSGSSADDTLREVWSEDIAQDGLFGKLRILANNLEDAGVVQFRFKFKEYRTEPPYFLRVRYRTEGDQTEHTAELNTIAVNSGKNRELVIASAPEKDIRYEKGITVTGLEMRKHG